MGIGEFYGWDKANLNCHKFCFDRYNICGLELELFNNEVVDLYVGSHS